MPHVLSGLLMVLAIALLAGCAPVTPQTAHHSQLPMLAQVPVPTAYPLNTQQKMQAMYHWKVLAEDIACRVYEVLERKVVERQFPVYVAPSGTTPFAKSFHALLLTSLVEKNIAVSNSFDNALILSFAIDMVRHADRITKAEKGMYRALSPDILVRRDSLAMSSPQVLLDNQAMLQAAEVNVDAGIYTHLLPRVEVMITSTLLSGDAFLMRDSSIYYINNSDWWQYRQHVLPQAPGVVNYQLVDQ